MYDLILSGWRTVDVNANLCKSERDFTIDVWAKQVKTAYLRIYLLWEYFVFVLSFFIYILWCTDVLFWHSPMTQIQTRWDWDMHYCYCVQANVWVFWWACCIDPPPLPHLPNRRASFLSPCLLPFPLPPLSKCPPPAAPLYLKQQLWIMQCDKLLISWNYLGLPRLSGLISSAVGFGKPDFRLLRQKILHPDSFG